MAAFAAVMLVSIGMQEWIKRYLNKYHNTLFVELMRDKSFSLRIPRSKAFSAMLWRGILPQGIVDAELSRRMILFRISIVVMYCLFAAAFIAGLIAQSHFNK
jgi:hypothetical protein